MLSYGEGWMDDYYSPHPHNKIANQPPSLSTTYYRPH